ncbi:hypothetical protein CCHR01_17082 [Colletotrichum chrysophilum]|uniref:Uncharacterized protein n=1 Tax=Colletotrichum chrysophilum TaxID=1836956 RepID=A0AAD9A305_9PEZI|nr:hypothetical protein CCHR01_17082 [Colletotrichum chrysophilum]
MTSSPARAPFRAHQNGRIYHRQVRAARGLTRHEGRPQPSLAPGSAESCHSSPWKVCRQRSRRLIGRDTLGCQWSWIGRLFADVLRRCKAAVADGRAPSIADPANAGHSSGTSV